MPRPKINSLLFLPILISLSLSLASAQVPQLSSVPEGLSAQVHEELMRSKSTLQAKWKLLRYKVEMHNQRCRSVPADTPLAAECRQAMGQLQAEIALYMRSVEKFNLNVKEAIDKAKVSPLLSEKQEVELGLEMALLMDSKVILVTDPQVASYTQLLLERLANRSTRPGLRYTVKVVQRGNINAFALPGGYIYVHSGLVWASSNESELAGVMAHEIAHVAARHHATEIHKIAKSIGAGIIAGALTGPVTGFGLLSQQMIQESAYLKFTRDEEREADRLAVEMLYQAGIKPTGLITLFEKLRRQHTKKPGFFDTFFSTHPSHEERIRDLAPLLADPRFNEIRHLDSAEFQNIRARLVSP